jgi:ABC-type Fe3+/spermidine/putrescine transport system ATPase subunit
MVFQSYALFPHMSVAGNVGYGLKLLKLPKAEIADKVKGMLELVGLAGYGARMPHELSGGQQQRVQLARSLVLNRDILLLDEPLASLDAKLRKDMCIELKRIQEKVGITFIHVTHNQEEAMTIADRIAIIADGRLVEEGSTRDIYEQPTKRFTAEFIGENNLIDGRVVAASGGYVTVDAGFATIVVETRETGVKVGDVVSASVRSERIRLLDPDAPTPDRMQVVPVNYVEAVYLGLTTLHLVRLANGTEIAVRRLSDVDSDAVFAPGQQVSNGWRAEDVRLHSD